MLGSAAARSHHASDRTIAKPTAHVVKGALFPLLGALLLGAAIFGVPATAHAVSVSAEERALLAATNRERAAAGLSPLALNAELTAAAAWMAHDLAKRDMLSHTDSLGRGIRPRFSAFGVSPHTYIAENLQAGAATPERAVERWMNSEGHRANILNGTYTMAGVAMVFIDDTRYGWFWVMTYGSAPVEATAGAAAAPAAAPAAATPTATPAPIANTAPAPARAQSRSVVGFSQPFPPSGFAINIFDGGTVQELAAAVSSGNGRSVFVSRNGNLYGYIIGAPAFVNASFVAVFPGGRIPAGTGMIIVV